MSDILQDIIASGAHEYIRHYFGYQYRLGKEYIVPYLERQGINIEGASVLEIGSAEGGVLCALAERGATRCVGTDIAEYRLEQARIIADHLNLPCEYSSHDIVTQEPPAEFQNSFDIVILRDVIEHLTDTIAALQHTKLTIKKNGILLVVFPPYYSPFGGHQHTLHNIGGALPYIQALPEFLFKVVLIGGRPGDIEEVRHLRNIRMTIGKMRAAAKATGFAIEREEIYLFRPVFKVKFGLPPIRMNVLRHIPILREVCSTEAMYILRNV